MKGYHFILLMACGLLFACNKDLPQPPIKSFSDDFESYANWEEAVQEDGSTWTKYNNNEINLSTEPFRIDTQIVHGGRQSMRFHCLQADQKEVCKCNLNKESLYFKAGETVSYSAWYYVERADSNYGTFFVWDLEAVADATIGIRVMAWEENLELERNKMGLPNLFQEGDPTLFPVNRWTHLELEVKLSQYRTGSVRMWLDGEEILTADHVRTLPKDQINVLWGTHGFYDRLQAGITAKNGTADLVMYVDDLEIGVK